jgi:antitoxin (DNA-binding transcriptional repressor) of toxin-antitoxin stability system
MKTATVRDLRNNFSRLEAWLAEGETVEIRKRGETIAELRQPAPHKNAKLPMPDFAARRKKIWGDRCFTAEEVARMRADELEGEEG